MTAHYQIYRHLWLFYALLLLASQPLIAQPASGQHGPDTHPFPSRLAATEATYRVVVNGIPVGLEAVITLRPAEQGYRMHFKAENRLFRHEEEALFDWDNCTATPRHYRHASAGFGIRREGQVDFDWENMQARGSKAVYPLAEDALDALSVAMIARCNIARQEPSFEHPVAEPGGMETYIYRDLKRQTLKTPAGQWDTISVVRDYPERGRHSRFWAAAELDYFMVRMDHRENPFIRGRIELTGFRYLSDEERPSP